MRRHILPPPPPIPTRAAAVDPRYIAQRPRCECIPDPAKRKLRCLTEQEARDAEASIARHKGAGHAPVRFYQCARGAWHWTRMGMI